MDTVRDGSGTRYLLVKRSTGSSRVRDPRTGEERYVPNDDIEFTDESALLAVAQALPTAVRRELGALGDERAIGLLREISVQEPIGVLALLDAYDLCESDLHGILGELRAARLIEPADLDGLSMAGDRGYRTTGTAREALRRQQREEGDQGVEIETEPSDGRPDRSA